MQKKGTGSSASCITAFRQHWHNVLFQHDHWDCLILAWGRMYKNHYTKAPIQQTHVSDLLCDIFFGLLLIPPTKLRCFITSQLHDSYLWLYLEYWHTDMIIL